MLFKFLLAQWYNPTKGDWTEIIRKDLEDLNLSSDIESYKLQDEKT